ncbi:MAG: NAD(+) diphosphatase [Spirochaetia bacterium]
MDALAQGPQLWFVCRGSSVLVTANDGEPCLPLTEDLRSLGFAADGCHVLGTAQGRVCMAASVPLGAPAPEGFRFEGLRSLFDGISYSFFTVAARALEVVDWDLSHRFCGKCGTATTLRTGERARECPACGSLSYPRISPAIIVAVVRDGRILLARAARFPPGLRSVLAGYVEPGETLEECVHREVREETGIEISNLRYFGSQPWPFPHSLMVAFTADHARGEIVVDASEIMEADWYGADQLPEIPGPMTVARRLIDWFRDTAGKGSEASRNAGA